MIVDPVKIGNMALSNCGISTQIESFDENTAEANQIKLWYDMARRQALAALDWNFARKRLTLSLDGDDAPEEEWSFRYQYPADCLVLRKLVNPVSKTADAVPFIVENNLDGTRKTILTDMEEAIGLYTFDLTDTTLFSETFVNALSFLLATYIAISLTGKRQYKSDNATMYINTLRLAQTNSANEKVDAPPRETDWVRERA